MPQIEMAIKRTSNAVPGRPVGLEAIIRPSRDITAVVPAPRLHEDAPRPSPFSLSHFPVEVLVCLGLCLIIFVSSIWRSPNQELGAIMIMSAIVGLRMNVFASFHLGSLAMLGLVLTSISPQQLFFVGLLGLAGFIAIEKEGLLRWAPPEIVNKVLYSSLAELIEHDQDDRHQREGSSSSESTFGFSKILKIKAMATIKGYPFAILPENLRWALLPSEMRQSYELQRNEILAQTDQAGQESLVKVGVNKVVESVETTITDGLKKEAQWFSDKVTDAKETVVHHPVVWWVEKLSQRSRKKTSEVFYEGHGRDRVLLLALLAGAVYLVAGKSLMTSARRLNLHQLTERDFLIDDID